MPTDDTSTDAALETVRELVANNPGLTADELTARVAGGCVSIAADAALEPDRIPDLLAEAAEHDLLLEADSKYWVMRTGAYSPEQRGHIVDGDGDPERD